MRFRINGNARQILLPRAHFRGQRIDLPERIDLVAPHFDAVTVIFIGGIDFDHVAAHAERAAAQVLAAVVLDIDELAQQRFARGLLALFQHDEHAVISFGRAEAVNAGYGGHDDNVAAFEQGTRRAHAQLVQLVVDGGFLVDVDVRGGNVRFGLVKIVVADEIFDGILRKESFELVIELCSQSFVVRQHQRGTIGLLDQLRHGEGLARPGYAKKHLVLLASFHAAIELVNRRGLVAARLIIAVQLEFHEKGLLQLRRPLPKPSLYSGTQALAFEGEK